MTRPKRFQHAQVVRQVVLSLVAHDGVINTPRSHMAADDLRSHQPVRDPGPHGAVDLPMDL